MRVTCTLISLVAWANVHAFPQYRIEFLSDIDGVEFWSPSINNRGDFVAHRRDNGGLIAVVNGTRHFIAPSTYGGSLSPVDINEQGVVALYTNDGRMFTWSVDTGLVELPRPATGSVQYEIEAINDRGDIIGRWFTSDRSIMLGTFTITADRQVTVHSSAYWGHDINNAGRTVGAAGFQSGFYRDIGGTEQLTTPYGASARPTRIDDDGTMYGWGAPAVNPNGHLAVLRYRTSGTVEELFRGYIRGQEPPVTSGTGLITMGIAPSQNGLETLHLWSDESGLVSTISLLDEESRALNLVPKLAWDMNANGLISIDLRRPNERDSVRSVLLRPVPEPGAVIALSAGLAALLRRRRAT